MLIGYTFKIIMSAVRNQNLDHRQFYTDNWLVNLYLYALILERTKDQLESILGYFLQETRLKPFSTSGLNIYTLSTASSLVLFDNDLDEGFE